MQQEQDAGGEGAHGVFILVEALSLFLPETPGHGFFATGLHLRSSHLLSSPLARELTAEQAAQAVFTLFLPHLQHQDRPSFLRLLSLSLFPDCLHLVSFPQKNMGVTHDERASEGECEACSEHHSPDVSHLLSVSLPSRTLLTKTG